MFRLLAYKLIQKGPSFPEASEVSFDRASGRYRAQTGIDEPVEGTLEMPEDLYNGMTGMLLRNLPASTTAGGHIYAFTPKPRLLRSTMRPEGEDKYFVGDTSHTATRYLVTMEIGGLTGVVASVLGKDPPDLRFWISTGTRASLLAVPGRDVPEGPDVADRLVSSSLVERALAVTAPRAPQHLDEHLAALSGRRRFAPLKRSTALPVATKPHPQST